MKFDFADYEIPMVQVVVGMHNFTVYKLYDALLSP